MNRPGRVVAGLAVSYGTYFTLTLWTAGSREEVDRLVDGGAEMLMLPMLHTPDEAAR